MPYDVKKICLGLVDKLKLLLSMLSLIIKETTEMQFLNICIILQRSITDNVYIKTDIYMKGYME